MVKINVNNDADLTIKVVKLYEIFRDEELVDYLVFWVIKFKMIVVK